MVSRSTDPVPEEPGTAPVDAPVGADSCPTQSSSSRPPGGRRVAGERRRKPRLQSYRLRARVVQRLRRLLRKFRRAAPATARSLRRVLRDVLRLTQDDQATSHDWASVRVAAAPASTRGFRCACC